MGILPKKSYFCLQCVNLLSLFAFTSLAAITVMPRYNYFGPIPMGFECRICLDDNWLVAYDIQGYPFHCVCASCEKGEFVLDENGDPIN